ncbi:hypothetical protein [Halochromatium salexigens]|uniref:Uncharacterized protein n=1 Tax=Halochromatium salexigens TaxID=49447 RepID=A0AAJ0UII6_HALSE|nr:hypothetical protein [Halochromatium salexigens]MBK5931956.1 hypothetical protein [Halochromatium salexigens]
MSEYQSFEFQALDQPLTSEEMAELRRSSSRAEITPTRFWNEYNWGDFKGNPRRWMERYFDAFLHVANWGSHWLMVRLPRALMSVSEIGDYLLEDGLEGWETEEHLVLSFRSETEDPGWEEGSGWLSALIGVRTSLMRGDRRSLYLGWLAQAGGGYLDECSAEPAVPPGLGELDATHRVLADFLRIPDDLVVASAESSAPLETRGVSAADIARWVAERSVAEKDALLTELIVGNQPHRLAVLRQRLERELHSVDAGEGTDVRRTVGELLARADTIRQERQAREAAARAAEQTRKAAEAAAARKRYLAALRGQEDALWRKVDDLIEHRHASSYQEAVERLKDLRDLADADDALDAFSARLRRLRDLQSRKSAFIRRLDQAGLVGK